MQGGYDNRAGCNDCRGKALDLSEPNRQRVDSVKQYTGWVIAEDLARFHSNRSVSAPVDRLDV